MSESEGSETSKIKPHISHNSGKVEWYTPPEIVQAAANAMGGGIDLDVASSSIANQLHKIPRIYTEEDSALAYDVEWIAKRLWLNPPYSRGLVDKFAAKLIYEIAAKRVVKAIWLSNNATETNWCQPLMVASNAICFPSYRFRFLKEDLKTKGRPLQAQMLIGFNVDRLRFKEHFEKYGIVMFPNQSFIRPMYNKLF